MNNKRVTLPAGTRLHLATILLVEDDENVRVLVQTMLLQHGYRVLCAEDSDEALKIAYEQPHHLDLLIADMVMPGMNGPQLAQRLRVLQPHLPVLFMTGLVQEDIVPGTLLSEAGFLEKPFTPQALAAKVQEILAGSAST